MNRNEVFVFDKLIKENTWESKEKEIICEVDLSLGFERQSRYSAVQIKEAKEFTK